MQVAEHFVGAPTAEKLDNVGIFLGDNQGHRAGCAERAGRDFMREKTEVGTKELNCLVEGSRG